MTLHDLANFGHLVRRGVPALDSAVNRLLNLARRLVRKHREEEQAICASLRDELEDLVVRHEYF